MFRNAVSLSLRTHSPRFIIKKVINIFFIMAWALMEMEMSGVQLAFDAVYVENNKTAHVVGNWIFLPLYLMDFPSSPVSRSDGIHQMLKLRIRLKASFIMWLIFSDSSLNGTFDNCHSYPFFHSQKLFHFSTFYLCRSAQRVIVRYAWAQNKCGAFCY